MIRRLARRLRPFTTLLITGVAATLGAGKILDLSAANRALARQNTSYAASISAANQRMAAFAQSRLPMGAAAPAFTLLDVARGTLNVSPVREPGPVHLIFADPRGDEYGAVMRSYEERWGASPRRERVLIVAPGGYEETRAAVARRGTRYPVAVHGLQVHRAYGVLDSPALVIVEGGRVRARHRLPLRALDAELPG